MKRHAGIIMLVVLLFSGCDLTFKSRTLKTDQEKIYASATACDTNATTAKSSAQEALIQKTSLPLLSKYDTLKALKDENGHCYEATVNSTQWAAYIQELSEEKRRLSEQVETLNNSIYYSEKPAVIQEVITGQKDFNVILRHSQEIAPVSITAFDLNQTRLEHELNARPSLKMDYIPCAHHTNYRCQMGFVSKVQNEDNNITYHWDFGDEGVSQRHNPLHTYQKEGTYRVTLRVEDAKGANSMLQSSVVVKASRRPFALFITDKKRYKTLEAVSFHNRSYTQKGKITGYKWDFGDGKRSSSREPRHLYTKAGTYLVSLKVCNSLKECASASRKLQIIQTKSAIDAHKETPIAVYMAKHGAPQAKILKPNALMSAYKYNGIWLLVKRGKIECAIREKGLVTNLMGQPKKCYWHEKHASQYMVDLQ